MKIIDCFIFYNEIELLLYRLSILYEYVDYFILVESTKTFVGNQKILYYQENIDLFSKFKDKIIHIIVDDMPYKTPNIKYKEQWKNERHQRNCIDRGIKKLSLSDDDIILISDVDEIIDPTIFSNKYEIGKIYKLEQDMYYYNLQSMCHNKWKAVKLLLYNTYINIKKLPDDIRKYTTTDIITKGGWHLSYFGDNKFIKNKIINFSHQEYNTNEYCNLDKIKSNITNGIDIFNRKNHDLIKINIDKNSYLPIEYNVYLIKYI